MINLKRRKDRYTRMKLTMQELGLKWKHFEAVDGKQVYIICLFLLAQAICKRKKEIKPSLKSLLEISQKKKWLSLVL